MIYGLDKLYGTHPALWLSMAHLGYRSKYDWKITSGIRNNQASLYALGRDALGNVVDASKVVTDAKVGQSAHEFGLAIDVQPTLDKGKTIVTDSKHPAWDEKAEILKNYQTNVQTDIRISSGLDRPHVQVRNWQSLKDWKLQWVGIGIVIGCAALAVTFSR